MRYEFGDIILVQFPFTNQIAFKQRPAVTVSSASYNEVRPDIIIMAITSQLRPDPVFREVWIGDWRGAHLLKPSAIKPVIATVEKSVVLRTLGKLQPSNQLALRGMVQTILG